MRVACSVQGRHGAGIADPIVVDDLASAGYFLFFKEVSNQRFRTSRRFIEDRGGVRSSNSIIAGGTIAGCLVTDMMALGATERLARGGAVGGRWGNVDLVLQR